VLQVIELLFIIIMALLIAQSQSGFITKNLQKLLQKEGISFRFALHSLTHITLYDIRYHHKLLAKELDLRYRLAPLARLILYFDSMSAKGVNLNAIESLSSRSKSTSTQNHPLALPIHPFVARLFIHAFYHYKTKNTLTLLAKEVDMQSAKIARLRLKTLWGTLFGKGEIKKGKAFIRGRLYPNLPPFIFKPVSFRLHASKKGLKAILRTNAIRYDKVRLRQVKAAIQSDYKKVVAKIKAEGLYQRSQANIKATLLYRDTFRYRLQAILHNPTTTLPIRPLAYRLVTIQAVGGLKEATFQATTPLWRIDGKWMAPQSFELRSSPILLAKLYPNLPSSLRDLILTLKAKGEPKNIDFWIQSNYAAIVGALRPPTLRASIDFLKPVDKINLPAINSLLLNLNLTSLQGTLRSPLFHADFTPTSVRAAIGQSRLRLQKTKGWNLKFHTPSVQDFIQHLDALFALPYIPNDGELDLSAHYFKGRYQAFLKAPKLTGEPSFLNLKLHGFGPRLVIDYYATEFKDHGIFATKPSTLLLGDTIKIKQFWIEDKILVRGFFEPKSQKGRLKATARKYHYSSIEGAATLDADLSIALALPKIEVNGDLRLLRGIITYAPKKIHSIDDPDIIVVDQIKTKEDYFTKNLALNIHIGSKKAILYKIPHLSVWIKPDLSLYKEYQKELEVLGLLKIIRGHYEIADQDFLILPSTLSFYGPPSDPLLDLHLKTRKERYTIFITISGDAQHPIVHFDSEPYLKPNEILSLLAFGSSQKFLNSALGGGRFGSLLSNLFLRDLLKQLGLKLDTLTLTTEGGRVGFEIGTHLSDKISILYKNDAISTIIVRYEISDHLEAEMIFGPSKSGAHLFYRKMR